MSVSGEKCVLLHFVPAYKVGGVELAAERGAHEGGGRICAHYLASAPGQPTVTQGEWITQASYKSSLTFAAARRAVREVRRRDPEVIVFSLWRSVFAFIAVRLLFRKKHFVVFLHNISNVHFADAVSNRLMISVSDAVWADSQETLAGRGTAGKRARPISMLLHAPQALKLPKAPPQPRFVAWSRLNKQKRVDLALRFIACLKAMRPDVRFTVIGPDDGTLPGLEALRKELGLEQEVAFVGPQDRDFIERSAAEATFYLQFSDYEGQAMAVVEAMQLGLVPVVTPVGAIAGYAADGVSALFVRSPDEAAVRVDALLREPASVERMAQAAREQFVGSRSYTEDVLDAAAELVASRA